jgi:hypothetical protein
MSGKAAGPEKFAEDDRWFKGPAMRARVDIFHVLALGPEVAEDTSLRGRLRLLKVLRAALRAMRHQGVIGGWSYDLARHRRLLAAYRVLAAAAIKGTTGAASKKAFQSRNDRPDIV